MPPKPPAFCQRSFEFFGTHASGTAVLAGVARKVAPDNVFAALLRDASVDGAKMINAHRPTSPADLLSLCPLSSL